MAKLIGTAGHVDHGKTTLIQALTGIDADRLPEEKARGMTIDIGFAYIDLPEAGRVSIVDVPGHEKFVTNMLVGALGVDVALLCVAADESVRPQTREHLQILELLPIDALVVALTRADLADDDLRSITAAEVHELLEATRFAGAPKIFVSAVTGEGLDDLRKALELALNRRKDVREGAWYLPIDRVFTVKGHGTVVTGSLQRGRVREGDSAVLMPGSREVRIRAIKSHDQPLSQAEPGMRVALNLGGIRYEDLERGAIVGAPGAVFESRVIDVQLTLLTALKYGSRVRVSIGADEAIGKAFFADSQPEIVQLRLEKPVAVAQGQPVILRRYSPPDLLGGGLVLVPQGKIRRKTEPLTITSASQDDSDAILDRVGSKPEGLPTEEICRALGKTTQALGDTFEKLKESGDLLGFAGLWFTPTSLATSWEKINESLSKLHESNPTKPSWPREKVVLAAGLHWSGKPLDRLIAHFGQTGLLTVQGSEIALASFRVALSPRQRELLDRVREVLDSAGINVPPERDIAQKLVVPVPAVEEILRLGLAAGELVRIEEGIFYTTAGLGRVKSAIEEIGAGGKPFTAAEVRDRLETTRKYVIPLLEYLDSSRFTLRQGEHRVLQAR
ncbi:MAG: selenocysteine-specific translation elongation factor [Fimbriimonadaceae bacterium]|nr:selenocysteine-specific translation elongation factor [Fimbriimonadaceae bacterium]